MTEEGSKGGRGGDGDLEGGDGDLEGGEGERGGGGNGFFFFESDFLSSSLKVKGKVTKSSPGGGEGSLCLEEEVTGLSVSGLFRKTVLLKQTLVLIMIDCLLGSHR